MGNDNKKIDFSSLADNYKEENNGVDNSNSNSSFTFNKLSENSDDTKINDNILSNEGINIFSAEVKEEPKKENTDSNIFNTVANEEPKKESTDSNIFSAEVKEEPKKEKTESNIFSAEVKEESKKENNDSNIFNTVANEESKKESTDSNIFSAEVKEEPNKENTESNIFSAEVKEESKKESTESNIFNTVANEEPNKENIESNIFNTVANEESKKESTESNIFNTVANEESKKENTDSNIFNTEVKENKNPIKDDIDNVNNKVEEISPFFSGVSIKKENDDSELFPQTINLNESNKFNNDNKIDLSNTKHYNVKIVKKKEPFPKFIIGVLSYALFIWLLLIGVALLVYVADIKIRALKGDYSAPKYNAYVVLSGSMLPEIQVYDVVVTKKEPVADLKVDDVITFASSDTRFEGTIITHRIINVYHDANTNSYTFQTKGDNNNVADSALVQASRIYGKVIFKIPKLGYLQMFLAKQGGWIVVILIPCLLIISFDIVKLIKSIKGKKHKNITVTK